MTQYKSIKMILSQMKQVPYRPVWCFKFDQTWLNILISKVVSVSEAHERTANSEISVNHLNFN